MKLIHFEPSIFVQLNLCCILSYQSQRNDCLLVLVRAFGLAVVILFYFILIRVQVLVIASEALVTGRP